MQPVRDPPTVFALVGQQVQLRCPISPGALIRQYFVTWSISDRAIYRTEPNEDPQTNSERYDLNPSNLSLIINSVQLEDASNQYRCVLTVLDPNSPSRQTLSYNTLRNVDIPLRVLGE